MECEICHERTAEVLSTGGLLVGARIALCRTPKCHATVEHTVILKICEKLNVQTVN